MTCAPRMLQGPIRTTTATGCSSHGRPNINQAMMNGWSINHGWLINHGNTDMSDMLIINQGKISHMGYRHVKGAHCRGSAPRCGWHHLNLQATSGQFQLLMSSGDSLPKIRWELSSSSYIHFIHWIPRKNIFVMFKWLFDFAPLKVHRDLAAWFPDVNSSNYGYLWHLGQLSCVQNSFWSPGREFKAYVGAFVCLHFPRFCLRHNNVKQLAYASLTANQPWGYAMILLHLLQMCTALKVHASHG